MLAIDAITMRAIDLNITSAHSEARDSSDVFELPARKRRRTTHISNSSQANVRVDVLPCNFLTDLHEQAHKLCALAIAVDVDLFGHLARSDGPIVTTHQLAAATGVEARLLGMHQATTC